MQKKNCLNSNGLKIKIKLYGPLVQRLGKSHIEVRVQKVRDIFDFLDRNYGTEFRKNFVSNHENIDASMQVVVNGEVIRDLDTKIQPGDDIKIMPIIGGG